MPEPKTHKTYTVVFDWNGTLLDDLHAVHESVNRILETGGHPRISLDYFCDHYENTPLALYGGFGFSPAAIETMLELEQNSFHDHYEPLAEIAILREGALDILDYNKAHNINSIILSNHIVGPIRQQLQRLDIEPFFSAILAYSDRVTQFRDMTKSERLHQYMDQHDIARDCTLIIGDSVEEIDVARAQGLISVAITGGCASETKLRSAKPDYVIHALPELATIIEERGFAA